MASNCKKTGFVNGCFDILHPGHLKMIQYCRKYCDYLIIGIDSDKKTDDELRTEISSKIGQKEIDKQ